MNEWLDKIWLDNPVRHYLVVILVILFVLALKKFISRYLAGLLYRVVHGVWKDVDKGSFINLVVRPLGNFLLILVAIISLHKLRFPAELDVDVYRFTVGQLIRGFGTIILIVAFIGLLL